MATDKNGKEVVVGNRAVVLTKPLHKKDAYLDFNGRVGQVRDLKMDNYGSIRGPRVRVSEGPEDFPDWSIWCRTTEIAMV